VPILLLLLLLMPPLPLMLMPLVVAMSRPLGKRARLLEHDADGLPPVLSMPPLLPL